MFVTRRQFMKASVGTIAALAIADKALALTALQPVVEVDNPLGEYPDRSWERVYHDQYRYDSSFTYCCSPNDTHQCRVRAFVRNGVVMRVEQNYDHQTYEDLYGNRGTFAWNPRMCLKGYTFHRRVYGPYRLKGLMAQWNLANRVSYIRKGGPDKAVGGRPWSSYTLHGDQPPDHPFLNGIQTSDIDHADMRFSKLNVSWGKNFVEHKMPEAHWFIECMERGGRIVVIVPEYSPPATKADYWIPLRPASDGALFLGVIKVLMDENLYDADFCKQYTDSPILIRTDTLQYLDPHDVIKDYKLFDLTHGYTKYVQAIKQEYRERLGDFMVWDTAKNQAVPMHREMVGVNLAKAGIDPALEGTYRVKLLDGKEVDVMPIFQMYKIHVQDFDLDTTHAITQSPKDLIVRWARDCGTIKPMAIHSGEGVNHWFHRTTNGRGAAMITILTGTQGKLGTGSHNWSGNY